MEYGNYMEDWQFYDGRPLNITNAIDGSRLMKCSQCDAAEDTAFYMEISCTINAPHDFTEVYQPKLEEQTR